MHRRLPVRAWFLVARSVFDRTSKRSSHDFLLVQPVAASGAHVWWLSMASSSVTTNEKTFWTEFIQLYRNNVCLWRVKSKIYMDRNKINEAYETLLEKLQEYDADATIDTVKRKLQNFRTVYRKKLKKSIRPLNQVAVPMTSTRHLCGIMSSCHS